MSEPLHAEFAALSARHFAEPLLGRYAVQLVDHPTWEASFKAVESEVFPGDPQLDLNRAWTEAQRQRMDALNALMGQPLQLNTILVDLERDGAPMGWAYGQQDSRATWYMAISAIHPAWRGQGIYPAYLARLLPLIGEAGFREVHSRHNVDNNPVLIPKLRAGFIIGAFEITPNYGLMVHLRYNYSEAMRSVYRWRVDGRVGADELRKRGILQS